MNPTSIQRTADSLLRAFGSASVSLRFPGLPSGSADAAQLGLAAIATEDITISPAVVRPRAQAATANQQQYELLLSATAIEEIRDQRGYTSDAALFNAALGAVVNLHASGPTSSPAQAASAGVLLRITSFSTELVGSTAVLHRVMVQE